MHEPEILDLLRHGPSSSRNRSHALAVLGAGMSDWQPIETAPKDGSEVLLFSPRKCMIWIGYYTTHARTGEGGWVVSQLTGLPEFCPWQATHWMPLPPPPSSGLESSSKHPAKHEQKP